MWSEISTANPLKLHDIYPTSMLSDKTGLFVCLLFWSLIALVSSKQDCSSGPCFPAPANVQSKFVVNASSTCGLNGPENYCLSSDSSCLRVCDTSVKDQRHPASYVNDAAFSNTFWKSGNYIRPVYLQIDFGAVLMLYRSVVTFMYEVPAAMYFAKSINYGTTFVPINYHATDCTKFFSLTVTQSNRRNGLAVECFRIYAQNNPSKQVSFESFFCFLFFY